MLANSAAEVVQLSIGAVLGTVVSINLSRFGLSLRKLCKSERRAA